MAGAVASQGQGGKQNLNILGTGPVSDDGANEGLSQPQVGGSAGHTVQARALGTVLGRCAATLTLRRELRIWHGAVAGSGPHVWRWGLPTKTGQTKTRPDQTGQDRTGEALSLCSSHKSAGNEMDWTVQGAPIDAAAGGQSCRPLGAGPKHMQLQAAIRRVYLHVPAEPSAPAPGFQPGHSAFVPLRGNADGGARRRLWARRSTQLDVLRGVKRLDGDALQLHCTVCASMLCAPQRHGAPGTVQTCHDDADDETGYRGIAVKRMMAA
ncbi:hypothetical protein TgHK011_002083 [Trichoderma gracile]|nr:hypothetical protein TgHK011_002083 [Trichoderma gracile]